MSTDRLKQLEQDGIVRLPDLVDAAALRSMQEAFGARLRRLRWTDVDGYEKTELFRHMVQHVLTLDQGFVDLALHPQVIQTVRGYLGEQFRMVEAKGWKTLATHRSFHGWHGDAWYDQELVQDIPRELKLAFYLSDVESGEFQYVRGSHRQEHPRMFADEEVLCLHPDRIASMTGPAGSAFLFDTSGIHRQAEPVLTDRQAIFLAYHDPTVPLQAEDVAYHRYHPLLLNAAFLGNLSEEDRRILGFGDKSQYIHAFGREPRFPVLHASMSRIFDLRMELEILLSRIRARIARHR